MTSHTLRVDAQEYAAILAGLRYLADALHHDTIRHNDGDVGDILTDSGALPGLSASGVHDLADALQAGERDAAP